jgi:hypothetical protein
MLVPKRRKLRSKNLTVTSGGKILLVLCEKAMFTSTNLFNVQEVNVRGLYFVSKSFIKHLKGRDGTLFNISSGVGMALFPGRSNYSVGKGAAHRLVEYIHLGIIVLVPNQRIYTDEAKRIKMSEYSVSTLELSLLLSLRHFLLNSTMILVGSLHFSCF